MTAAPRSSFKSVLLPGVLLVVVLGLWARLIDQLHLEWSLNPQYSYGWAVPFLCLLLLWRRFQANAEKRKTETLKSAADDDGRRAEGRGGWLLFGAALVYLPTRLVQEANPDWRLVSWALALEVIAITAVLLGNIEILKPALLKSASGRNAGGEETGSWPGSRWQVAFPLLFFLVAVPWPTVLEAPVIQTLTRANVGITIELLNFLGLPALQRGNVIEISTGLVGIDDACSGIRSLQATLMIALFLGEIYALSIRRRFGLVAAGFLLAFMFNVLRTTLLVSVAAREGIGAIGRWHDPAGVTILVGCFLGLWMVGWWLEKRQRAEDGRRKAEGGRQRAEAETRKAEMGKAEMLKAESVVSGQTVDASQRPAADTLGSTSRSTFQRVGLMAFSLCAWLGCSEVATEIWYRLHESSLGHPLTWEVQPPAAPTEVQPQPIAPRTATILRYDAAQDFRWTQPDGTRWQVIFLQWNAGRVAAHLARNHTPEVCLSAAGHQLQQVSEVIWITAGDLALPFRRYTFIDEGNPLHVFYCLREDRLRPDSFTTESLTYESRWAAVRAGRRNLGQRSVEIAIWGLPDAAQAEAALREQLPRLIVVK